MSMKNGEGLVSSITCVTSGEREVDVKTTIRGRGRYSNMYK